MKQFAPRRPISSPALTGTLWRTTAHLLVGLMATGAVAAGEIHEAIRKGDAEAVRKLISQNPQLLSEKDTTDGWSKGSTPLVEAVDTGNTNMVFLLVQAGANVNEDAALGRAACLLGSEDYRALHKSLTNALAPLLKTLAAGASLSRTIPQSPGDVEQLLASVKHAPGPESVAQIEARLAILRCFMEHGANAKAVLDAGPPLLHWVVTHSSDGRGAELLLQHGADPNHKYPLGSPLHYAVGFGNTEAIRVLVKHGADVETDSDLSAGATPLIWAATLCRMPAAQVLLELGAKVGTRDRNGRTALYLAARAGCEEVFRLLLEKGANPSSINYERSSILNGACLGGNKTIVELLLAKDPDLEQADARGFTPLLSAAEHGHAEIVKLLLARGADPKAKQDQGMGALHLAAGSGKLELVQLLLDKGANVNEADRVHRTTSLSNAALRGWPAVVKLLIERGAKVESGSAFTPLMMAAIGRQSIVAGTATAPSAFDLGKTGTTNDYRAVAELLIAHGVKINAVGPMNNWTALHIAAQNDNAAVAEVLIAKGAALEATDQYGFTPLHLSARKGNMATVTTLLAHGAKVDAVENTGAQPLHCAAGDGGRAGVVELLLRHGADVRATESHGGTPLHCAAHTGSFETARVLLQHKAPVNSVDKYGQTPLHMAASLAVGPGFPGAPAAAVRSNKLAIAQLLLQHGADKHSANVNGLTPAEIAKRCDFTELVLLLEK
jgi:ankyrin repeat protein